ncbi:hypothetical protein SAMN02745751_00453 [Dethiosulfatibacter aminovorans DSM 17477]|uniref:Peptide chain release factor 1 (ERF1) n=1 Tax=Dethiosulfatibacter aminovorans DSM 17477 TaxID=1121476 RepID=A0A1M6BSP1_9FIRM|nr:hypothetical protein [Dethiosulfatibacter aminovorans]SHI51584.1 hypothetical protein SAMN02745751_00453 [Dethiosulfatibacter aminovorans DSM 17477]
MNQLRKDDVLKLIKTKTDPCISIYLPTEKAGKDILKGRILLKNLLKEAEKKLSLLNISESDTKNILNEAYDLIEDLIFWQNSNEGLALFISGNTFKYFKMPVKFQEKVHVSKEFNIIPLLSMLTKDENYYLLSLSQKNIKLYRCDEFNINEIELDMPTSLDEALQMDNPERQLQYHSGNPNSTSAIYHGHGGSPDDNKNHINRFMQMVSNDILEFMPNKELPLIVSGVSYIASMYKDANKYPNMMDQHIDGNPDNIHPKELKERAHKIMYEMFNQKTDAMMDKFSEAKSVGNGSDILEDIIAASYEGRINKLFLTSNIEKWGYYDENLNYLYELFEPTIEAENVINIAAINTLKNGGDVLVYSPEEMNNEDRHFATFRY